MKEKYLRKNNDKISTAYGMALSMLDFENKPSPPSKNDDLMIIEEDTSKNQLTPNKENKDTEVKPKKERRGRRIGDLLKKRVSVFLI